MADLARKQAKIILATAGSLGDIHPYMAIARELQARGHRVVIATSAFEAMLTEAVSTGQ